MRKQMRMRTCSYRTWMSLHLHGMCVCVSQWRVEIVCSSCYSFIRLAYYYRRAAIQACFVSFFRLPLPIAWLTNSGALSVGQPAGSRNITIVNNVLFSISSARFQLLGLFPHNFHILLIHFLLSFKQFNEMMGTFSSILLYWHSTVFGFTKVMWFLCTYV